MNLARIADEQRRRARSSQKNCFVRQYYVCWASGRGKGLVEFFINVPHDVGPSAAMLPKLEGELTRKHSTKHFSRLDGPYGR